MPTASATVLTAAMSFALLLPVSVATAQDFELPTRKPGQWEIKIVPQTPGGGQAMTMQACIDAASDAKMMRAGFSMSKQMCTQQEMKHDGDTYVIDSTCQIGPMQAKSHIVIAGDFQSAYTVDITTETAGAPGGMAGSSEIKQEARWAGAECAGGMAPGDIMIPGGVKMNIDDMMKMMGGG